MAVEEHFSKELLESQGRKESVILKYDESLWFKPRGRGGPFDFFRTNIIETFRQNKIYASKRLSKDLKIAKLILDNLELNYHGGGRAFGTVYANRPKRISYRNHNWNSP